MNKPDNKVQKKTSVKNTKATGNIIVEINFPLENVDWNIDRIRQLVDIASFYGNHKTKVHLKILEQSANVAVLFTYRIKAYDG